MPDLRISTGLPDLDRSLGHLRPGRLVVFSGISQSGMTTMLLTLARAAAVDQGVPTMLLDLETDRSTVKRRLVAGEAGVDDRRIRDGSLADADRGAVETVATLLNASPIHIPSVRPSSVEAVHAAVLAAKTRPRLVLIDAVRYLTPLGRNQEDDLDRLSAELKILAGRLGVAVVVTHPHPHTLESERAPSLGDVTTAYGFVGHSDQFVIIHRPGLHDERPAPRFGFVDLRVVKNRHGPPETVEVGIEPEFSRFVPLAPPRWAAA